MLAHSTFKQRLALPPNMRRNSDVCTRGRHSCRILAELFELPMLLQRALGDSSDDCVTVMTACSPIENWMLLLVDGPGHDFLVQ